jgi:putative membrane protein (TIGR04086 family)
MPVKQRELRTYLLSTILGAVAGVLMLPLFSFVIWIFQLPVQLGDTFALLAFGVGCLVAGIMSGVLRRTGGLLGGLKAALLLFLVLIAVTLVMGNLSGEFILGRLTVTVICGSVGGVIGVNRR